MTAPGPGGASPSPGPCLPGNDGGRLPPSRGARSFLPLPLLGDAGRRIRGRSCRARQFGRENRIAAEVNGIVDAVNWVSGYDSLPGPANDMQRDVLARFEGLVRGRQPDAKLQEPQAALRELLRGRSPYDGRGGPTTVAS